MAKRIELIQYGNNAPNCPSCGMGNALLDWDRFEQETMHLRFKCRDCGLVLYKQNVIVVKMEVDKEVDRVNGENF